MFMSTPQDPMLVRMGIKNEHDTAPSPHTHTQQTAHIQESIHNVISWVSHMSRQMRKKGEVRVLWGGIDNNHFTVLEFQGSALQNRKKKNPFILAHKTSPKLPLQWLTVTERGRALVSVCEDTQLTLFPVGFTGKKPLGLQTTHECDITFPFADNCSWSNKPLLRGPLWPPYYRLPSAVLVSPSQGNLTLGNQMQFFFVYLFVLFFSFYR